MASQRGIAAFDLDGTLLRGRTVCQMLAVPCGRVAEADAFERSIDQGALEGARTAMARWYQSVPREELLRALESAEWAPEAEAAVSQLAACGVEVVIASITWSFAVEWFAKRLGVRRVLGTELRADNSVRHVWPRDKGEWLLELARRLGVASDRIAAIGDSAGDAELLRAASLRVFVGAAVPAGVEGVHHMPGASLGNVAELIIGSWGRSLRIHVERRR